MFETSWLERLSEGWGTWMDLDLGSRLVWWTYTDESGQLRLRRRLGPRSGLNGSEFIGGAHGSNDPVYTKRALGSRNPREVCLDLDRTAFRRTGGTGKFARDRMSWLRAFDWSGKGKKYWGTWSSGKEGLHSWWWLFLSSWHFGSPFTPKELPWRKDYERHSEHCSPEVSK